MVRKLKFHEQKLLKKVDFLDWKDDAGHRESTLIGVYHIQNREDYHKYNKVCGHIRQLANKLSQLDAQDPCRLKHEKLLVKKLDDMGIFPPGKVKISDLENKVTVAAFCKRRIPVVMCRLKMAENIRDATKFVEQGHVRIGPQIITDTAFLVTKSMEDYLTWVDTSKIRQNILKYRNEIDDYNLM